MQHLQDNELSQALKVLAGPPTLATEAQIQQELPKLISNDHNPPPLSPQLRHNYDPADLEAIKHNINNCLSHPPKHCGAGPAGERYEHYSVIQNGEHAKSALTTTLSHLVTNNIQHSRPVFIRLQVVDPCRCDSALTSQKL